MSYIPVNVINTNTQLYCILGIDCPVIHTIDYTPFILTLIFFIITTYLIKKWITKRKNIFIQS